jgi:hypothetical protein
MAITQIGGTNNGTATSGTSVTITKPTGVAEGDVLTALLSTTNQTFTAPAGWTRLATGGNSSNWSVDVWYKVAGPSEPASYGFSVPVAGIIVGAMNAWRGVNNADPIGALHAETVTNSNLSEPHVGPSVDATGEASGRICYVRAVKATSAASYTINDEDITQRSALNVTSGGVTFTNGWFSNTLTYSTDGVKPGVSLSINVTETNNFEATYILRSLPEGSFSGTLGSVTGDATGGVVSQGSFSGTLGSVTGDFAASGIGGPFSANLGSVTGDFAGQIVNGSMACTLPAAISTITGAVAAIGGISATLSRPTSNLRVETRPFGGRVILVRPPKRGLLVVGDTLVPILLSQVYKLPVTGEFSGTLSSVQSTFDAIEQYGSLSSTLQPVTASIAAKKVNIVYAVNIGDGSTTTFVVTHNLNSRDVLTAVYEAASPYEEVQPTSIERTTANTVTVKFPFAPTTDQYRVVVVYG